MTSNEVLFEQVLSHFDGSASRFAKAVGDSIPAVCNWRARGIPAHRAQAVSALTGISLRDLRPDDWQLYWPDAPKPASKRQKAAA